MATDAAGGNRKTSICETRLLYTTILNYANRSIIYSNKRRPRISAAFGTKKLISAALGRAPWSRCDGYSRLAVEGESEICVE